MKKLINFILAVLLVLSISGCGGAKSTVYTQSNKDTVLKEIRESNLSDEERALFAQAIIKEAFGGEKLEGKKVGDIIDTQRKFVQEQARIEAEKKAKQAELEKLLSGHVVATIAAKKNLPADIYAGRYSPLVVFDIQVLNTGSKDIQAFKGYFQIRDLVGQHILNGTYYSDNLLKAGQTDKKTISFKMNEFMDNDKKLYNTDLGKLDVKWKTTALVFTDGTKIVKEESLD